MSIPRDRAISVSDSTLPSIHVDAEDCDARTEKKCPHYDEYTTLLKKHLDVVESENRRLKNLQVTEPVRLDNNNIAPESKAREGDLEKQEVGIRHVPSWEWRQVKYERAINPNLPILIASSKGHGKIGRRSGARRTTKHGQTPASGNPHQNEVFSHNIAYRLAINSTFLLNLLGDCTDMDFPEDRNVWLRPFKYLVAYEKEIRQTFKEAEATLDLAVNGSGLSDQADNTGHHDTVSAPSTSPVQGRNKVNANAVEYMPHASTIDASRAKAERDHIRCLIDFMDSDMQDIFEVKHQVSSQTLEEVAFEHLWLLYRPGDLVYTIRTLENRATYQAFRILHVTGGRPILDISNNSKFNPINDRGFDGESETEEKIWDTIRSSPLDMTSFIIDCFSIDFDGSKLGPKSRRFIIPTFTGKRKMDALELRPSFTFAHHESLYQEMVERGRRFTQIADGTHKRYSGATLRESKELLYFAHYNHIIHDEEVQSEVMIDQSAAVTHFRKAITRWKFTIGGRILIAPTEADSREVFDPLPVKRDEDVLSDVFDDSIIDQDRRNDFVNTTPLLKYHQIRDPSLSDDYVMLLPFRVYGYAMLIRKWFPLNMNSIHDITPDQVQMTAAGYGDLVLPEGHNKLLQAIVKNNVRDPQQTCSRRDEDPDEFQMDVVKGKGKGLIVLLHGAPGVGKTSTAECVAAQLKRPLLQITCGDISTNVKQAEESLQEYCTLAHRWRCVLLLDEADVFLARREKGDIKRNGLVSVFLRVLEYFSGVIILTTNRVGEFDEAFRSRIHVSLYYPKLDQNATLQIWDRSLMRLRNSNLQVDFSEAEIRRFAEQHWLDNEERSSRQWNGRQIKNAFQAALALANWEFYEGKQSQNLERPLLKAKHFKAVAKTSAHFDDYISNIYHISDDTYGVLAARAETRNDGHPAMSLGQSDTQDFVPRSRRATPGRRGAGIRNTRAEEGRQFEGGSDSAKIKELELKLKIMELQRATGKEEVQARAGNEKEDEDEEEW